MIPPVIPMVAGFDAALAAALVACAGLLMVLSPIAIPAAVARASRMTARPVADSQPKNAEPHLIPPNPARCRSTVSSRVGAAASAGRPGPGPAPRGPPRAPGPRASASRGSGPALLAWWSHWPRAARIGRWVRWPQQLTRRRRESPGKRRAPRWRTQPWRARCWGAGHATCRPRSPPGALTGAVGVAAVLDVVDQHGALLVVDQVEHPVLTAAGSHSSGSPRGGRTVRRPVVFPRILPSRSPSTTSP